MARNISWTVIQLQRLIFVSPFLWDTRTPSKCASFTASGTPCRLCFAWSAFNSWATPICFGLVVSFAVLPLNCKFIYCTSQLKFLHGFPEFLCGCIIALALAMNFGLVVQNRLQYHQFVTFLNKCSYVHIGLRANLASISQIALLCAFSSLMLYSTVCKL